MQDLEPHFQDRNESYCTMCKIELPHSHCKCRICGNPECVCELTDFLGK